MWKPDWPTFSGVSELTNQMRASLFWPNCKLWTFRWFCCLFLTKMNVAVNFFSYFRNGDNMVDTCEKFQECRNVIECIAARSIWPLSVAVSLLPAAPRRPRRGLAWTIKVLMIGSKSSFDTGNYVMSLRYCIRNSLKSSCISLRNTLPVSTCYNNYAHYASMPFRLSVT